MIKKLFSLTLATLLVFAAGQSLAEMSDSDYHSKMSGLHNRIRDAYTDFIRQKGAAQKAALDELKGLGNSEKDLEARKAIHQDCEQKVRDLRAAYKEQKEGLIQQETQLRQARKDAGMQAKKTHQEGKKH